MQVVSPGTVGLRRREDSLVAKQATELRYAVRFRSPGGVQTNKGMVLVALMFFFTPLVMSCPMMGSGLGFFDAFFEAVSGVTTFGLSTKATLVGAPPAFLFARAWMQWYEGLGIVVLSLALVIQPGLVAKGLAVTEDESDDLVGSIRAHARRVLIVYSVLTGVGIIDSLWVGVKFCCYIVTLQLISLAKMKTVA